MINMLYPYAEFPGHLIITYTDIKKADGKETLEVNFEKPADFGFKEARFELPSCKLISNEDFSDKEIITNQKILKNNQSLIWEMARNEDEKFA